MPWNASAAAFAAFFLIGCGGRDEIAVPMAASSGAFTEAYVKYEATGLASWYGDELRGNRTASGAIFDPRAITVAHRTLPLGSFVEVTAMDTGRSIVALVNDRGPGRKDRIVDLSRGAAQLLGTDRRSVASVRLRAITPTMADAAALRAGNHPAARSIASMGSARSIPVMPSLDRDGRYSIQIASFSSKSRARALADVVDGEAIEHGDLWRVLIGPYKGADAVQRARDAMIAQGYGDTLIVPGN